MGCVNSMDKEKRQFAMNRRDFFKLTGLGAGAAFLVPTLLASAWTEQWKAEDAVKFAVAHAQACGPTYADATVGPCEVFGHSEDFAATCSACGFVPRSAGENWSFPGFPKTKFVRKCSWFSTKNGPCKWNATIGLLRISPKKPWWHMIPVMRRWKRG